MGKRSELVGLRPPVQLSVFSQLSVLSRSARGRLFIKPSVVDTDY